MDKTFTDPEVVLGCEPNVRGLLFRLCSHVSKAQLYLLGLKELEVVKGRPLLSNKAYIPFLLVHAKSFLLKEKRSFHLSLKTSTGSHES